MIVAVASVPATPLLIPEVAAGAAGELDDVRAECRGAIAEGGADATRAIVVVGGARTRTLNHCSTVSLGGLGLPLSVDLAASDPAHAVARVGHPDSADEAAVGVAIGAWLLASVGWTGERVFVEVGDDTHAAADVIRRAAEGADSVVIAVADASAGRTEKAPAALVPGAVEFDTSLVDALRRADLAWFTDPRQSARARAMACSGVPVWAAVASALETVQPVCGHVSFADPYGVGYPVATWLVA